MNGILESKNKLEWNQVEDRPKTQIGASNLNSTDAQKILKERGSPMSGILTEGTKSTKPATPNRAERRKQRRATAKVLVRLRPDDCNDPKFEEVLGTENASRANLYVVTSSRSYYKLMRLRVTFPYDAALDNPAEMGETAEVVRLDHLPGGRTGVAVKLQRPVQSASRIAPEMPVPVSKPVTKDQRFAVRHSVSASATLVETESKSRLQARCSDLSVAGCYIDTMNPFPKGSRILLQLNYKNQDFVALARVVTNHIGMGMGLTFEKLGPEQTSILADWFMSRSSAPAPQSEQFPVANLSESTEEQNSPDRALLLKLVRMLGSNAKLMPL